MVPTEVRRSQTVTVQKTKRKAKADVGETRGDETPRKGREPPGGGMGREKGLQNSESACLVSRIPPPLESRRDSRAVDVSRWRLENVGLSCPADGIKREFGCLLEILICFIYALSVVGHCWTFTIFKDS